MPPTHLLYLHGFRSSPQSFKARCLADWLTRHRPDVRWWCPQLPPSPRDAMALLRAGIEGWPVDSSVVVGSSLGGFYATLIGAETGWPAVLLNPAVDPARDLAAHIGLQTAFHDPGTCFDFRPEHVNELQALALSPDRARAARPERNLAMVVRIAVGWWAKSS
ncbi:MAG: YqiA/YcfP family alpha/beta fold hydrolase [Rubrivivax sp.]